MAINFSNWEEREQEIKLNSITLNEGTYTAIIASASFIKKDYNGTMYDAVHIIAKVVSPENFAGKVVNLYYVLDAAYPHPQKVEIDKNNFDKLIYSFRLSYSDPRTLALALVELIDKKAALQVKLSRSKQDPTKVFTNYNLFLPTIKSAPKTTPNVAPKVAPKPAPQKVVNKPEPQNSVDEDFEELTELNFDDFS